MASKPLADVIDLASRRRPVNRGRLHEGLADVVPLTDDPFLPIRTFLRQNDRELAAMEEQLKAADERRKIVTRK